MTGTITHNILLTRLQGGKTILLTRDGVPKDPYRRRHGPAEEGRMTPTLPPFVRPGSLQSPTFCWMLCDPSVSYRIWFWPSADAENTKPHHDEKSLHRHTIPCFASSKSPFGLQLGSRETPLLLTMKRRKNVVYGVTNVEQHKLFRFDASRPLPDVIPKRADSLAVVEGVLSNFFKPTAAARESGMSARPAL